jgi:hypothetical protein
MSRHGMCVVCARTSSTTPHTTPDTKRRTTRRCWRVWWIRPISVVAIGFVAMILRRSPALLEIINEHRVHPSRGARRDNKRRTRRGHRRIGKRTAPNRRFDRAISPHPRFDRRPLDLETNPTRRRPDRRRPSSSRSLAFQPRRRQPGARDATSQAGSVWRPLRQAQSGRSLSPPRLLKSRVA